MDIDNGRYRLIRRVGSGGTGVVYQAADCVLGRTVAVKAIHPSLSHQLLEREGHALARITHQNVVALHDMVEIEGRAFLIMEYVEGCSLHQWLADHDPLNVDHALAIFRRIAAAVRHAHAQGVLHCDLKPANVLISTQGEVKLTDFTLARLQEGGGFQGLAGGSAAYAAPEQMDGGTVDARTDVFGLGALLARMVGPIDHSSDDGRRISSIIERATAPEPDERFPSVDAILEELPESNGSVTNVAARSVASDLTRVAPVAARQTLPRRVRTNWHLMLLPSTLVVAIASLFLYFHASAAPESVRVPNLVTVGRVPAEQVARSLALRPHTVWSYSSAVPAGLVISQRPAGWRKVPKGATVTLVVSEGPAPVAIPDVHGLKEDAGALTLRTSGFHVDVRGRDSIFQSSGVVLDQSPLPGTRRVPGTTVVIIISRKPWWWIF